MDTEKLDIVKSVLKFLSDELDHGNLDAEQKESLDVARQCLESTYELDSGDRSAMAEATDLYSLFNVSCEVTEEMGKAAEDYKVRGNECMKIGKYSDAIEWYTKAIDLNPRNHVFYCNRAAAFSRLEKHWHAITDCKDSIKIQPTAKAFGRLGVAYSNLKMYKDAKEAYAKAHELDPTNETYEQNLKLAEEYLQSRRSGNISSPSGSFPGGNPFDFNNFMNNPALLNIASQMLNDPAFRTMVSGIMSSVPNGDPNIDAFVEVGQQLAQQMQASNPNLMETLRQNMPTSTTGSTSTSDTSQEKRDSTQKPPEN